MEDRTLFPTLFMASYLTGFQLSFFGYGSPAKPVPTMVATIEVNELKPGHAL